MNLNKLLQKNYIIFLDFVNLKWQLFTTEEFENVAVKGFIDDILKHPLARPEKLDHNKEIIKFLENHELKVIKNYHRYIYYVELTKTEYCLFLLQH